MISLYPDQQELVDDARSAMRKNKSVLVVGATGIGKTRIATHMIEAAKNKNSTTIFTVPRRGLLKQTSDEFNRHGISHSFIAAGYEYNPYAKIYIGMVDTMARRISTLPPAKLLIPDETHHGDKALNSIIRHYKTQGSWILGLSATPHKNSGKGLGCWYDTMVEGKSIRWLIDNKRLSDYRLFYGRSKIDLSGIKITAGDYAKGQVADFMENEKVIIGDCVRDYRQRCMGRIHLVRCASIKHSQITAQKFRDDGIPAMHVDGKTPDDELKRIFKAWALREILVVCFCDLIGMGFDLAMVAGMDVCIESGSDTSPNKSLAKQMQFWGRLLRIKPESAIVNDHVNNFLEHGRPCDDREWTLEDREIAPRSAEERVTQIRQCSKCFYVHKPSPSCPQCGFLYSIQSREVEEVEGETVELGPDEILINEKNQRKKLYSLIGVAKKRGYANPEIWAAKILSRQNAVDI